MRHSTRFNIVFLVACSIFTTMLAAANPASAAYPSLAAADGKPAIAAHKVRLENNTVELALQVLAPGKTVEAVRIDNLGGVSSLWRSDGRDNAAPLAVSHGGASLSVGSMPMIFNPGNTEALLSLSFKDNGAFTGKNTDFRVTVFFTGGERTMYALSAGDFPATVLTQVTQEAPAATVPAEQAAAPVAVSESSLSLPLIIGVSIILLLLILGAMLLLLKKRSRAKQTAELLAKASRGDAKAQFEAFEMYKNKQDKFYEAIQFLSQSAKQGYAEAQAELGLRCQAGNGVEQNSAQAVEWFQKAADQGLADAQYNLALCLQAGDGITKNVSQAVTLFREAADQNHSDAQCELGLCYMNGDGIELDNKQAMSWLKKASDHGSKKADETFQGLKYLVGAKKL